MNMEVRAPEHRQSTKLSIIDCDFHPRLTQEQLKPFLSNQWWSYLQTYGNRQRHGQAKGYNYPKMTPQASRRDSWPPNGGTPGTVADKVNNQMADHRAKAAAFLGGAFSPGSASPRATTACASSSLPTPRMIRRRISTARPPRS